MTTKRHEFDPQKFFRVSLLLVLDSIMICLATAFTLLLRFEFNIPLIRETIFLPSVFRYAPVNLLCTLLIFWLCRLYHSLWEFASFRELMWIGIAAAASSLLQWIGMRILHMPIFLSFPILYFIFLAGLVMAVRLVYRYLRILRRAKRHPVKRTMLIGAGMAGAAVLREMQTSITSENKAVCFIDDDPAKWGQMLQGVPVVGGRGSILFAAEKYRVEEIVLAIPSASSKERRKIADLCQKTPCVLKILPGTSQLINGEVTIPQLRKIEMEDLLGRDTVQVDMAGIGSFLKGKTVLVTGGGGSIGSELCRQIAGYQPQQLIIFDIYENNAYDIQMELVRKYPQMDLKVLIGSVRDRDRLEDIFATYRPQLVYHAAAHKHVPLMEDSPAEAVKNNVFGTLNTAELAAQYGVERFLLISSDKAVNPTNIMGATKRVCEMIIQMVDRHSKTEFVAVRFGNVLGSNGSVIPLFRKQIAEGGPVTVTHPNIIRYFMTIPEAVALVLQAGVFAKGGEIFILDMGEPVRIDDLARNMIRLSGFEPDVDIQVRYTGLRPGEKLYEEILLDGESNRKTANDLIYIGKDEPFDDEALRSALAELSAAASGNDPQVRDILVRLVPTFHKPAL